MQRPLPQVREQVREHQEFLEAAEAEYSRHLVRINAEEPDETVFLSFCDAIESSLPAPRSKRENRLSPNAM